MGVPTSSAAMSQMQKVGSRFSLTLEQRRVPARACAHSSPPARVPRYSLRMRGRGGSLVHRRGARCTRVSVRRCLRNARKKT